jgi:adenylate kinase
MRIVLLGAPGSGKGTQSQHLMARASIPQISTGDLLRAAVANGTELGLKAKEAMEAGRLVDDDIVLGMFRERLAEPDTRRGFILDGFPRNLAQAHALERLLAALKQPLDAVVQLEVDYAELVRRLSGRRSCADCGRVFNVLTAPAAVAHGLCPKTGAPHRLIQRADDNEATVRERLRVYEEKTRPLIDFYRARGLLRAIDAAGDVNEVTRRLMKALGVPAARRARKVGSGAGGKARKKAPGGRSKVAAAAAARRRNTPQQSAGRSAKRRPAPGKSRAARARRARSARRR